MAVSLTVNNVTYQYPELSDEGWGPDATNWALAITQGVLQKSGGLFSILGDIDFGPNFGLKTGYYKTRSINIATAGQFRLANVDVISWRNAGNTANLNFGPGSSDAIPQWGGVDLVNLTATQTLTNKTFTGAIITGGTFNSPTINTPTVNSGTFSTPSITNPTFTGQLSLPNGSVAAPTLLFSSAGIYSSGAQNIDFSINGVQTANFGLSSAIIKTNLQIQDGTAASPGLNFQNDPTTGIYRVSAGTIGISTSGTLKGSISSAGVWTLGASTSTQAHVINGTSLALAHSASASIFNILRGNSTAGALSISGGSVFNDGGEIILYGSTHASKANFVEFQTGGSIKGSISAAGLWTLGATGSTGTHTFNANAVRILPGSGTESVLSAKNDNTGSLALTGASGSSNGGVIVLYGNSHATKANIIEFQTAAATRGSISATGAWSIGTAAGTQAHVINGTSLALAHSASASIFNILRGNSTAGALSISGGSVFNDGGEVILYGSTHASKANIVEFQTGGSIKGSISAAGAWTIGATGGTQTHVINGDMEWQSPTAELTQESLKLVNIPDNSTGTVFSTLSANTRNIVVEYSISRGTAFDTGTMLIVHDGTNAQVAVNSISIGDTGITFSADISASNLRLRYVSTSTGIAATFKYNLRRWNS